MTPVEYRKIQPGRVIDGFNYLYNPENPIFDLGLLIYNVSLSTSNPYQHNRWDVEVEAIPGAANAKLFVKSSSDVASWTQGQLKILSREEGSSDEIETTYSYTDFQAAANNAIQVADLSGATTARKFKIVVLQDFLVAP